MTEVGALKRNTIRTSAKVHPKSQKNRRRRGTQALLAALGLSAAAPMSHAASLYWNKTAADLWSTTANWWTTAGGPANPASAPGVADTAIFNGTGINAATTVQLNANTSVLGMTFANTGTTLLQSSNATPRTLTLGSGGLTINAGAGAVTLGNANPMPIILGATQTWTNNSGTTLTVGTGVSGSEFLTSQSFTIAGNGNTTFTGPIANGDSGNTTALIKTGAGTLTLAANNSYYGGTFIRNGSGNSFNTAGTLKLDFAAATAPTDDIIANGSELTFGGSIATPAQTVLGGGVLNLTQKASTDNTQAFGLTNLGVGASSITMTSAASNALAVNLNSIVRTTGGTLNISQPTGTLSAINGVQTISGTVGAVMVDGNGTAFATVGGTDWATKDASNSWITAFTGYTAANSAATFTTNSDANITGSFTATSGMTVNSIRVVTGSPVVTFAGVNTISTGGVLVGAGTTTMNLTGGTIRPGAGRELVFINHAANASGLNLNSVIADSADGESSVTYRSLTAGATTGLFGIGANNTYTGDTYITAGRVSAGGTLTTPFGTGDVYVNGNTNGQFLMGSSGTVANHFYIVGNGWNEGAGIFGALRVETGTLSGTITLLGDAAIGAETNGVGTISGTIEGAFNLTKIGGHRLALSGTNTYTGTTTVNTGTLRLNSANALPGGINPTGGISGLRINGGMVGLGNGDFLRGAGTGADQVQWIGSGGFSAFGAARNVNLGGAGGTVTWASGGFVPSGSTLVLGAGGDATVDFQNAINLNNGIRTVQVDNQTPAIDAKLTGVLSSTTPASGGLTKTGAGTLSLSATNTYAGATTVSAGILRLDSADALPGGINPTGGISGLTFATGGIVGLTAASGDFLRGTGTGASQVQWVSSGGFAALGGTRAVNLGGAAGTVTWATDGFVPTGSALVLSAAESDSTVDFQNPINLNNANRIIQVDNGTAAIDATLNAVVSSTTPASGGLTKTGGGTLTIGGTVGNTFTGTAVIDNGVTHLSKTGGAFAFVGNVQMGGGNGNQPHLRMQQSNQFGPGVVLSFANASGNWGRFDLGGTSQTFEGLTAGNLTTQGGAVIQNVGAGGFADNAGAGTLTLNGSGNFVYNGFIRDEDNSTTTDKLALVYNGTGSQTLVGSVVTYTGPTTLNSGTLALRDTTAFGSAITVNGAATLNVTRTALGFASRSAMMANAVTGSGIININNAANTAGTTSGGWTIVSGATGSLNFSGTLNINSGVFSRDNTQANTINGTATVNVAAGAAFGAGRGGGVTIGALNGAGDVGAFWNGTNAGSITIGNGGGSGTFSGVIHGNGSIATDTGHIDGGVMSVIKVGAGNQTFSGANTYTGSTTINAGTLTLAFGATTTNILPAASALVLGGSTLALTGTGTQTINAASTTANTINAIVLGTNETLTVSALTLGAGSALNFNTAAGGANGATVGSGIVVLPLVGGIAPTPGAAINVGLSVTDVGGYGLATVNGSNQVIRLTGSLLPASGATSATDYAVDNNGGGAAAPGSSTLAVTASQAARTIAVDTTTAGGVLTLNSGVVLSNNAWSVGSAGAGNAYQITGSAGGAGLRSVNSGDAITITNNNAAGLTIDSPILANGTNAVTFNNGGTSATTTLTGANTYTGATTIGANTTLQIGGAGTLQGGAYAGAITNGGTLRHSSSAAQTLSGIISGAGGLLKEGTGTLTLTGANTYTGATTVSSGNLTLTTNNLVSTSGYTLNDANTGSSSTTLRVVGGFSNNRGGVGGTTLRDIAPIVVANQGTGTTTLDVDSTTGTWINSTAVLNKAVTLKSTAGGIRAGFITFSGSGAGAGNDTIIYDATGSGNDANWNTYEPVGTYVAQPNTYTGNVRFTGGSTTLQNKTYANATYANLMIPDTASVTIDSGSTFNLAWGSEAFDALNGGGTLSNSDGVTLGASNGSGSFSGVISGGGSLTKAGSGTQTLTGTNTYTGATNINAGIVTLGTTGKLHNTSAITIASGATLNLSSTATGGTGFNQLVAGTSNSTLVINGALNATTNQAHTFANGATGYFTNFSMNNGTLANTFGPNTAGYGAFYFGGSRTITATGTNTISGTGVIGVSSGTVLTLSPTGASDFINVTGTVGASPNGIAGGLAKAGAGTVTLSGASTYTGGTTVSAGTLLATNTTGSATGTGAVAVNTGGTLGGTGTIGNTGVNLVSINNGGTIAPGLVGAAGKLTTGAEAWLDGGKYVWDLTTTNAAPAGAGVAWDLIELGSGALTTTALTTDGFTIEIVRSGGGLGAIDPNAWFTIAHAASITGGSIDVNDFLLPDVANGGEEWEIQQVSDGGTGFYVQVSPVPEPASAAVLVFAAGGMLARRRRRSRA